MFQNNLKSYEKILQYAGTNRYLEKKVLDFDLDS